MTPDLIERIGKQLYIKEPTDSMEEAYNQWTCQVIYSAAGKVSLASLWDHPEDEEAVSIQHFKRSIKRHYAAFISIYPQVEGRLASNIDDLATEIYDIYLRAGYLYHAPNRISPAARTASQEGGITLYRGISPDTTRLMSGLGFYSVKQTEDELVPFTEMFGLQAQPMERYLEDCLEPGQWRPVEWPESTEFLRPQAPFNRGYWTSTPARDGKISLARYGESKKTYVFYRFSQNRFQQKPIKEWRLRDYHSDRPDDLSEYRRIAVALLQKYKTLPPSKVVIDGATVEIHLGYRLPPAEDAFFRLYSWPATYNKFPQTFNRIMAPHLYTVFKHHMEGIGFHFIEE